MLETVSSYIKHISIVGGYSSYQRRGILSAPIFLDNVACYGSEERLIDCFYHMDTTEDKHNSDIWINCETTDHSTSRTSAVALAVSLTALGVGILIIVFLTGYILYKRKRRVHQSEW